MTGTRDDVDQTEHGAHRRSRPVTSHVKSLPASNVPVRLWRLLESVRRPPTPCEQAAVRANGADQPSSRSVLASVDLPAAGPGPHHDCLALAACAGIALRRRLQPRAVARGDLGRGRRADARGRRQPGHRRRLLLGAAASPSPGRFDFGWLDRVLDLLHDGGIAVDLATATASPPPWLASAHPETPARSTPTGTGCGPAAGRRTARARRSSASARSRWSSALAEPLRATTRRWRCGTSTTSTAATTRTATATSAPPRSAAGCATRYGDLDALNEAWGTAFWSQRYGDLDEVLPPRRPRRPSATRPSSWTSRRFCSDELLDLLRRRARPAAPAHPGRAGDDQLHGRCSTSSGMDYWPLGAASRTSSPTTTT